MYSQAVVSLLKTYVNARDIFLHNLPQYTSLHDLHLG